MKRASLIILLIASFLYVNGQNSKAPAHSRLVPGTQKLYVAETDEISKMLRPGAVSACAAKGDGWRLPTLGEMQIIFGRRYEFAFTEGTYWTSDKVRGEFKFYAVDYKTGKAVEKKYDKELLVRCVYTPVMTDTTISSKTDVPVTPPTIAPAPSPVSAPEQLTEAPKANVSTGTPTSSVTPSSVPEKSDCPPYKHSIGVVVGSMQGVSYKTFPSDHFAIEVDLATKVTLARGGAYINYYDNSFRGITTAEKKFFDTPWTFELNVNFLAQDHFIKGLYGMIGGGPNLGYNWNVYNGFNYGYYYIEYNVDRHYYNESKSKYLYDNSLNNGKAGLGLLLGLEYRFEFPLALQLDFRPGGGLLFNRNFVAAYFDWGLNFSIRYCFD